MTSISLMDGWSVRTPLSPFGAAEQLGKSGGIATTPVRLPHDALRDIERTPDAPGGPASAFYPNAHFTYLRTLEVPASWEGKVIRLEIQGAHRRAMVFVNEELAGNRADGYARFFVDLTPYLRFGADNALRIELRSGQDSRWYSGAGLHRPVRLHVDEPVHVVPDGVRVTTVRVEDDQAVIEVATTATNAGVNTRTVDVNTSITGLDGAEVESEVVPVTVAPQETVTVRQRFYVQAPALWSPDNPALYSAHVALGDDAGVPVRFGIRTVTVDPKKGLRINGEPVVMRGACIHHDNGPLGAAAIGRAEERRVELLKKAGFNAIRASHNPVSPAMLDACDRLGMLVMDEAFDMWTRFKTPLDYAADFPQWWAADLDSIVAKDYNHPSVIMYSIGNEIAEVGTPHGARIARQLAEHLREQDPTRLITNGVNLLLAVIDEPGGPVGADEAPHLNALMANTGNPFGVVGAGKVATRRTAESSSVLDVVGFNYGEQRYELDQTLFPNRVIVGSETFGPHIGILWPQVMANPNVIGDFTWTGWDYLGEVGVGLVVYADDTESSTAFEGDYPALTAWVGDIDITGHRRPLSYYREIVYGLRTEPYIAALRPQHHGKRVTKKQNWAWSDSVSSWTWPGFEGKPITVEVYADADEVVLLLDGAEVARATVGEKTPMLAEIETTYCPGTLEAVALREGQEIGRTALQTADVAFGLAVTADRTTLQDTFDDLAFIAIELRDAAGVLVTGADRPVTVTVEGAGELAGMCSANPVTTERFADRTWRTFDGRAIAVVRPTRVGDITVRVDAGDLGSANLTITVTEEA